jgi:hypothetical protein
MENVVCNKDSNLGHHGSFFKKPSNSFFLNSLGGIILPYKAKMNEIWKSLWQL